MQQYEGGGTIAENHVESHAQFQDKPVQRKKIYALFYFE
jgi:hypothetical protein